MICIFAIDVRRWWAPISLTPTPGGAASCIAAMTQIIITAGRAQKSPRDQRNHSQVRGVGLALSYTTKSALFPHCHRIDAAFSFLPLMRSCKLPTTKKEMCR